LQGLATIAKIISLDRVCTSFKFEMGHGVQNRSAFSPQKARKIDRMRALERLLLGAAAILVGVCTFSHSAVADMQGVSGCSGCNGYTFSAVLTPTGGNNYSLSYTITNVSGAPATAQSWSLTLFQSGGTISTTATNPTMSDGNNGAYSVELGKSNNGSNGNCNSNLSDGICVTYNGSSPASLIGAGQSLTFSFDFSCTNCTELSAWDFLSHGYCDPGSGNCYAISAYGVGVPESSANSLLVSELVLLGAAVLVFRKTRNPRLLRWSKFFRLQPRLTS
jgi:hypothetical protein